MDIKRAIQENQKDFQAEQDKWATERADVVATKEAVVVAKLAAEVKTGRLRTGLPSSWSTWLRWKSLLKLRSNGFLPGSSPRPARSLPTRWAARPKK